MKFGEAVDVVEELKTMLDHGKGRTQKSLAKELGVAPTYLNDILHRRREPGEKVLDALGIERITCYRYKKELFR